MKRHKTTLIKHTETYIDRIYSNTLRNYFPQQL